MGGWPGSCLEGLPLKPGFRHDDVSAAEGMYFMIPSHWSSEAKWCCAWRMAQLQPSSNSRLLRP